MRRFFLTWLAILATCWLVLGALFAPVVPGGWLLVLAVALATTLPVVALVRGFRGQSYPGRLTRIWLLRPFWYAQLLAPIAAAVGLLAAFVGAMFGEAGTFGRGAVIAFAVVAGLVMLAGYVGSRRLVVRHFVATSPDLPAGLEGLRIAQLSDVHVGPHTPRRHLARVAAMVREARPDLVTVTGDLVDDYAPDVEHFVAGLGTLRAPLGTYAIAGNHDVYAGWSEVRRRLEAHGLTVLVNEARVVTRGGERLVIVGVGDPAGRGWSRDGRPGPAPDVAAAMADAHRRAPGRPYVIALAHNPVLWPELARRDVALTLSGHTHWGQFALPWRRWSLASPFLQHAMGEYVERASVLYIHPGTNYWGLPFRLGTPPEVAIITLRRGEPGFATEDGTAVVGSLARCTPRGARRAG